LVNAHGSIAALATDYKIANDIRLGLTRCGIGELSFLKTNQVDHARQSQSDPERSNDYGLRSSFGNNLRSLVEVKETSN
jgi:hypothetical protein